MNANLKEFLKNTPCDEILYNQDPWFLLRCKNRKEYNDVNSLSVFHDCGSKAPSDYGYVNYGFTLNELKLCDNCGEAMPEGLIALIILQEGLH